MPLQRRLSRTMADRAPPSKAAANRVEQRALWGVIGNECNDGAMPLSPRLIVTASKGATETRSEPAKRLISRQEPVSGLPQVSSLFGTPFPLSSRCPEIGQVDGHRVDVGGLANYRSFQAIDNEGKNLFGFVAAAVWNLRRQLLDWLAESYPKDSDRVDLLYAILNYHGWIRSDNLWLVVRLEPPQQPARRHAQEQICRKLMGLGAKIPGGKWLRIEVGDSPL